MTRPISSSSTSTTSATNIWHSPLPYLFGGLGLMLLLITAALIILVCSYCRTKLYSTGSNRDDEDEDEAATARPRLPPLDPEPKIVVIMAGDEKPTFLANPVLTSSVPCTCQHVEENQFCPSAKGEDV